MIKKRIKFLKLLRKYRTLSPPEICKKMHIKKHTDYETDYSSLIEYIKHPGYDEEFDSMFDVVHFQYDAETSSKSEFKINNVGLEFLKNQRISKMTVFTIITGILSLILALIGVILSNKELIITFLK